MKHAHIAENDTTSNGLATAETVGTFAGNLSAKRIWRREA